MVRHRCKLVALRSGLRPRSTRCWPSRVCTCPCLTCSAKQERRCPGNHASGGKRKSGKTRKGDHGLTASLGVAALAAVRTKDTYLSAQYRRLVRRLGNKQKAIVALQHSIVTSVWHMLTTTTDYQDLGGDYFLKPS